MLNEAKKFTGKSLQPARPMHHLSSKEDDKHGVALNFQTESPSNTEVCVQSKVGWVYVPNPPAPASSCYQSTTSSSAKSVESFENQDKLLRLSEMTEVKMLTQNMMPCEPKQHESEVKKERIKYSRDFLLKLSCVSVSLKKPEFLPDHPIVLEKPGKSNIFIDMCKK